MVNEELGTVIATPDGPSVSSFSFVVKSSVQRGEFISVKTQQGILLASIENVIKTNKYFESAGAVQEYSKGSDLHSNFPVGEWEYTVAQVKALGVYVNNNMQRVSFPPSPGSPVNHVEDSMLNNFLGLDQERGLHLGIVQQHKLDAKFSLHKMVKKHLAILAISGAGKSYTTSVLIEELLSRPLEQGRIAIIIMDNHGEYTSFAESQFSRQVEVINAKDIRINISDMSGRAVSALFPDVSTAQRRELGDVIDDLKAKGVRYDLPTLIEAVRNKEGMSAATKNVLAGLLKDIQRMNLFSSADFPGVIGVLQPGKAFIINFRNITSQQRKQLIVEHFSRQLFNLRKAGKVPPFLEIIEEAHNFCPGGAKREAAISRSIIQTLAREGRKFSANICLISQRPVRLDTTALSQCNTQIIMRITNPNDLDHIRQSAEAISGNTLNMISGLSVGEALIIGEAVKYPALIKIRKRKSKEVKDLSLEEEARLYEEKGSKSLAAADDFI